ncbi:B-cell receptor CD22-like [Lacerta agilis]|uniref:B-cell receptor CD22-like n=1 Tax=Lacerta agilis TaxID=80427 RepID=UPI00141912F3|nr:B-cell receptor CD22-like [Lacerta agilis]
MRSFLCLLFLPGILGNGNLLTIAPNNLATWEGSCILIPCKIGLTYNRIRVDNFFLIWYFDPEYVETLKDYSGIMLYNGSTTSENYLTPTSLHFLNRVSFVGNLTNRNCSLKISHLQKNDSGKYGARLYGFVGIKRKLDKWFADTVVNIDVSPPKPMIESSMAQIREQRPVTVTCWVFYHCPDEPIILTLSGLEESRMSSQKTTNRDGKVQTVLRFTPTWEDHRKMLTCTLKSHNGTEISKSTMTLDVKYGPKRVKLSAMPGITVCEGEKLSLACTVNSSNPGVTYQWYWKDARKYEWTTPIKEFDSIREQDSGVYRCTAENTFGFDSSELTINVQSNCLDGLPHATSGPKPKKKDEETQASSLPGCTLEQICSLCPTTQASPQPQPSSPTPLPLPSSSQIPCKCNAFWEEFYSTRKSQGQNKILSMFNELRSAIDKLINELQQIWPLHESTMRSFLCLLFLPGILSNENLLTIAPNNLATWEGSCILIPCKIGLTYKGTRVDNFFLIWYFDPEYVETLKDYSGIMLYNGSTTSEKYLTPTDPHFPNRVSFVGNLANRNCSLKISHLQKNDSGKYGARLYGFVGINRKLDRWFADTAVNINVSPPKPMIESSMAQIREQRPVTVTCWVFYHCPDEPIILTLSGLEEIRMSSQKTTDTDGKVQTVLRFTPTWEDHRKILTCTLKSHNGTEISQSTMTLDVKYGPKRVKLSATPGITVCEGEKLSLACTVNSSNPGVTYQWYWKDSQKYEWTAPIKEFDSIREQDSGVYRCTAKNAFGFDSSELTINVQYPPKDVKIDMLTGIIKEGDNVVLRCSSRGNPATNRHVWYKYSESGIIGTDEELRFEAIQARDSSTYYCIACNGIGNSTSPSITLDVQYAPKNVQLILNSHQPITEGDTVALNCSVGSSNPSHKLYKWYKSEKRISHTQELYTFTSSPEKVSIYKCEVCNDISCTASAPVSVTTLFGPKDVKAVREPLELITEGSFVKLRCKVREANPQELTYIWYKEGQQLQLDSTVAIPKVTPEHSGSYYCIASNQVGSAQSSPVWLNVHYGPRNVHLLLSTQEAIIEGMSVSLRCDNDANPPANVYTWYWNKQKLQETSRILQLKKIQVDQSGSYHCKTSNGISEQESPPMGVTVSYSRATVLKRALIGLGSVLFAVFLLGLLSHVVQRWGLEVLESSGELPQ